MSIVFSADIPQHCLLHYVILSPDYADRLQHAARKLGKVRTVIGLAHLEFLQVCHWINDKPAAVGLNLCNVLPCWVQGSGECGRNALSPFQHLRLLWVDRLNGGLEGPRNGFHDQGLHLGNALQKYVAMWQRVVVSRLDLHKRCRSAVPSLSRCL